MSIPLTVYKVLKESLIIIIHYIFLLHLCNYCRNIYKSTKAAHSMTETDQWLCTHILQYMSKVYSDGQNTFNHFIKILKQLQV